MRKVHIKPEHRSLGSRLIKDNQTVCDLLLVLPLGFFSPVDIVKGLSPDPHVDHDPLHDASDAEEDGKEPVRPELTFPGDEAQEVPQVFTPVQHVG